MKLITIPLIFLLSLGSVLAQSARPNRFTTNSDPGAWVFIPMPQLASYTNGTNFSVDWLTNAYKVQATGDVWFQYSTNWGLAGTNRFATLYFPPTQNYRHIYFANAATNWHSQARQIIGVPTGYGATIKMQSAGSGETNVFYTPDIDAFPTGTNWQGNFLPSSIGGLVLWIEASQQAAEDEFGRTPITFSGQSVRSITDLSGTAGRATNSSQFTQTGLTFLNPNNSPANIPSLHFSTTSSYLVTSTFSALTQPNWCFLMFRGRGTGFPMIDGLSEGNRFGCIPTETSMINTAIYNGTTLGAAGDSKIEWRLFSFKQNTTTSLIRTNGVQAVSGNAGTQTPTRWTFGSDYTLASPVGDASLAEVLVYHADMTATQVTNVESYFWNKYGTPHP